MRRATIGWYLLLVQACVIGVLAIMLTVARRDRCRLQAEATMAMSRRAALELQVASLLKNEGCGFFFGSIGGYQVFVRPTRVAQ